MAHLRDGFGWFQSHRPDVGSPHTSDEASSNESERRAHEHGRGPAPRAVRLPNSAAPAALAFCQRDYEERTAAGTAIFVAARRSSSQPAMPVASIDVTNT